jgi:serine/threonine protein phosphatase PrpC
LFYNSETILNRENILEHFKRDYKKQFQDVEFSCKKGKNTKINQDSFFSIVEDDINGKENVKIFGVFDGHGLNGHLVSSFAMGQMAEFMQNSSRSQNLSKLPDDEINKLIRKCFRYTQDKIKAQFGDYLIQHKTAARNKENERNPRPKVNDVIHEDPKEDEISYNSDEKEFLENISWDTESDPEDVYKDDELIKQYF